MPSKPLSRFRTYVERKPADGISQCFRWNTVSITLEFGVISTDIRARLRSDDGRPLESA